MKKETSARYRLRVWNAGGTTAYNVEVSLPNEYGIIIMNHTMPFEYLKPRDNYDECVAVYDKAASKFKVISTLEVEEGIKLKMSNCKVCS